MPRAAAGPTASPRRRDGDVYYASLAGSHIARIDTATGEATPIEPPTAGQGARRVWSDSRGRVWVSEWNAGQVSRLRPEDAVNGRAGSCRATSPQAYAVYVDDHDDVWLTDFGANAIVRFDPKTETFQSFSVGSGQRQCAAVEREARRGLGRRIGNGSAGRHQAARLRIRSSCAAAAVTIWSRFMTFRLTLQVQSDGCRTSTDDPVYPRFQTAPARWSKTPAPADSPSVATRPSRKRNTAMIAATDSTTAQTLTDASTGASNVKPAEASAAAPRRSRRGWRTRRRG